MILNYYGDLVLGAELGQLAQPISGPVHSFLVTARTLRVDANAEAAEKLCRFNPLVVILHCLFALCFIGVAQRPFVVDHNQAVLDTQVLCAFLELGQVRLISGLVFEELIDVLDRLDSVVKARDLGDVEVVQFL